jgi:hypothetical protein
MNEAKTIATLYTPKWIRDLQEKKKAAKKAAAKKEAPKRAPKAPEKDK